jgi:predicted metalloprotease with PDZ domain
MFLVGFGGCSLASASTLAFTVTPQPSSHNFHVVFRSSGGNGKIADFTMPVWMPGFYSLMHYAQFVSHFAAQDGRGHQLGWEQVTPNVWRVIANRAPEVVVSYDVAASRPFPANNSIDDSQAFIAPPGMFMYIDGELARPATVTIALPSNWHRIATGLAPVAGHSHTFAASDFDVLFDSPWLLGNQETLDFRVGGIEHTMALEYVPASVSRTKMVADLQHIVEAATQLMGVVPYRRYAFFLVGDGVGGIEHLNSAACYFNGKSLTTPAGYETWLSFVAHEYFHNFNVKRIRPLALGPFRYDGENLTNMLWVSEGLSVYYQDLLLVRAGLITPDFYLRKTMQGEINKFENEAGRPYESATEASQYTWNGAYGGRGGKGVTISYYDNGAMLGAMLDLAIRHDTHNARSLDDLMRALYRKFYIEDKRGFTDSEFRAESERVAGQPLDENFAYASSTQPFDYKKYFSYAGVDVTVTAQPGSGTSLGLDTDTSGASPEAPILAATAPAGRFLHQPPAPPAPLLVSAVLVGSPAQTAGLRPGDRLLTLNGAPATAFVLSQLLARAHPGDKVTIGFERNGTNQKVDVPVVAKKTLMYNLKLMANPDALQKAIFTQWLKHQPS